MNIEDCFQILELKPGATIEEVKAARNELLQVWHPDKYVSNSKLLEKAKAKSQKINEAFNILVKEFKVKEPGHQARNDRADQKNVSQTEKNADQSFRKDLKRLAKNQDARIAYQERRRNQTIRAKRQLNFTFIAAFIAGLLGLFVGLKELTLFLVLAVLIIGLLISFLTYRKPIKKIGLRH
jgi:curved DNA-binding protein CbpA